MYTDRISDMIAHFIGMFETMTDEARLRAHYTEGRDRGDMTPVQPADHLISVDKTYDVNLRDYDPGVKYHAGYDDIDYSRPHFGHAFDHSIHRLSEIASEDFSVPYFKPHGGRGGSFEEDRELVVHAGPGSLIAHVSQVNLLQDDDYLDMTDGPYKPLDTTFVTERTTEYYNEAAVFTPFSGFHRTDNYGELQSIAKTVHDYVDSAHDNDVTSLGTTADDDFVKADSAISGTYKNGVAVLENPDVNDFMPDRGAATPEKEPEQSDVSLEEHGPADNNLDVAAGANVVANFVALTNTGVMATVSAVMGDYHQIDTITQSYVYSDRDEIASVFSPSQNHMATVANNIATFERSVYGSDAGHDETDATASDSMIFPTAWRVSYIEGDVSFVHWIEQYHFISDNDTMTVTTSGSDVSVISGGNATLDLASFLGIGMQYDLVIVGGNVLDMSMITQIAVLYDNDWVHAADGAPQDVTVQSGNNLLWNEASIHNIGSNSRFDAMPDYISDVVKAINERDASMPAGLSTDPNFAGQSGVNVLYINGNLYDVNLIKQVSVLGDADHVTQAASNVLANAENATIHIDTGSNAVINIAHITDYDSFGLTTYVGGQLYSDAVLIQGGIIENDMTQPHAAGAQLANEVIAFLHDDNLADDQADGVINAGHDLSWSLAHPVDVMQTVVA